MEGSPYINRRTATKSYRPKSYVMSPGLMRAREPYKWRNAATGVVMAGFAAGAWAYSMNAVKQDTFEDVDEEARALAGSGAKSLEDEERERRAASAAAVAPPELSLAAPAPAPAPASAPAATASSAAAAAPTAAAVGILPGLLDGAFPRLLDPRRKTLVWGAPPVERVGRLRDA